MALPKMKPLTLSSSNPGFVEKFKFNVRLAQKTGTNGPRDLYSAYKIDFFDKYSAAFGKVLGDDLVIGYDGSRVHESLSKSAREYLRRCGINVVELDGPVTVPEFMFTCFKEQLPGCFFGRSHSPLQYIGLKLVINAKNALQLLEKSKAEIKVKTKINPAKLYGFLPRTLAPVIEDRIENSQMIHPKKIGSVEAIDTSVLREEFFNSLRKVVPLKKIEGNFIVDCRHSMAGEVWNLIKSEIDGKITLDNNVLNPTAPDRDPREIWDTLVKKYSKLGQAVFNHDADADRTFLLKTPGIGKKTIVDNQEESFTTGLLAEAQVRKPDAYVLVQERISLIMLSSLQKLTNKIYATAQGEPAFFLGATELLAEQPNIESISGADYTDIFYNKTHPICMKSPYQQALWLMYWFTGNEHLPKFPSVSIAKKKIDMLELDYPQRLEKVLKASEKITDYFEKNFELIYKSTLDGQNVIVRDEKENLMVVSIRPSGTGRYSKLFTEIGLGESKEKDRKEKAEKVNRELVKLID